MNKNPVRIGGNLPFAQAMHGKHNLTHADKRTKRNKTRSTQKQRAIADSR